MHAGSQPVPAPPGAEHRAARRLAMVEEQVFARGVRSDKVLDAMRKVPREEFLRGGRSGGAGIPERATAEK